MLKSIRTSIVVLMFINVITITDTSKADFSRSSLGAEMSRIKNVQNLQSLDPLTTKFSGSVSRTPYWNPTAPFTVENSLKFLHSSLGIRMQPDPLANKLYLLNPKAIWFGGTPNTTVIFYPNSAAKTADRFHLVDDPARNVASGRDATVCANLFIAFDHASASRVEAAIHKLISLVNATECGGPSNFFNTNIKPEYKSSWVPSGFKLISQEFAFKLLKTNYYSCDPGTEYCIIGQVIPSRGCLKGAYMEFDFKDQNGDVIDYSNWIVDSIPEAYRPIPIITGSFNKRVKTFSISNVECYYY